MEMTNALVQLMGIKRSKHFSFLKKKTHTHIISTLTENRPFTTSSKCGFQWTKMLIHCQSGGYFTHDWSAQINKDFGASH